MLCNGLDNPDSDTATVRVQYRTRAGEVLGEWNIVTTKNHHGRGDRIQSYWFDAGHVVSNVGDDGSRLRRRSAGFTGLNLELTIRR